MKAPGRTLKRGLTRLRNTDASNRSTGAQVKVEEHYLRDVKLDRKHNSVMTSIERSSLKYLFSRMGRKMSTASVATTKMSSCLNEIMTNTSTTTSPIILVPAVDMLYLSFLDFFEAVASIVGRSMFFETCVDTLRRTARQTTQARVEELQRDPDIKCVYFSNEHCSNVHAPLLRGETDEHRRARAMCLSVCWLQDLFDSTESESSESSTTSKYKVPRLILLTENTLLREEATSSGVRDVCGCHELLLLLQDLAIGNGEEINDATRLAKSLLDAKTEREEDNRLRQEQEHECGVRQGNTSSINSNNDGNAEDSNAEDSNDAQFDLDEPFEYYDATTVDVLLRRNILHRGKVEYDRHHRTEGWCTNVRIDEFGNMVALGDTTTKVVYTRILLKGRGSINRALDGDHAVVRLVPRLNWQCPEGNLRLASSGNGNVDSRRQRQSRTVEVGIKNNTAMTNDIDTDFAVPTGVVVGVLKHGFRQYVATLQLLNDDDDDEKNEGTIARERHVLCVPMNAKIPKVRLRTRQYHKLRKKRLLVTIDHWLVASMYPDGHVVRTLGDVGDLKTEAECLLIEHDLVDHLRPFSTSVLSELPQINIQPNASNNGGWDVPMSEVASRRDLRSSRRVVSIDPPGCQDIDDALSVHVLKNGNYEIGVHIADVTAFVRQGSPLDVEALHRGTTVYLVDRRLDMLPTLLSTNLCSLLCGVDRLAMSVIWEFDKTTLEIINDKTWCGRTLIRSSYALSYGQAQNIIDGRPAGSGNPNPETTLRPGTCGGKVDDQDITSWLRTSLIVLRDIGRRLLKSRRENDAVSFESHEVKFKLDSTTGKPKEVRTKTPLEVHSTIEEMMVVANSTVATRIYATFPLTAFLRRHAAPDPRKTDRLQALFDDLGVPKKINLSTTSLSECLQHAIALSNGNPTKISLVRSSAVKIMSEAVYFCTGSLSDKKSGEAATHDHYGLGIGMYTHFTSPIRRYADVIVHRLLAATLTPEEENIMDQIDLDEVKHGEGQDHHSQVKVSPFTTTILDIMSKHLNSKNREAKFAGSGSRDLFLALHLREHPETVGGVVVDVKENGFIVYCPKYGVRAPVYLLDHDCVVSVDGAEDGRQGCTVEKTSSDIVRVQDENGKTLFMITKMDTVKVLLYGEKPSMSLYRTPSVRALLVTENKKRPGTNTTAVSKIRLLLSKKDDANDHSSRNTNRTIVLGAFKEEKGNSDAFKDGHDTCEASNMNDNWNGTCGVAAVLARFLVTQTRHSSTQRQQLEVKIQSLDSVTTTTTTTAIRPHQQEQQEEQQEQNARQQWEVKRWSRRIKSINGRRTFGFHRVVVKNGSLDDDQALHKIAAVRSSQKQYPSSSASKLASDTNKLRRVEREVQRRSQKLAIKKREARRKR
jgi:exoribonuclease R